MTDPPGDEPEQRLPARRPEAAPAPAERFAASQSAHAFDLTPARAAGIVRQSASARWVGFLAVMVVVIFVILYYFYELGFPAGLSQPRLAAEASAQQVTAVERGYTLYQANCARCHGVNGEGFANEAGAPTLNDQAKLFKHLNKDYILAVLREGGRYVCGNAKSLMPVWANDSVPPGPLNYVQIGDIIAFLRATNDHTYNVLNPDTSEPTGKTFKGWVDPNYKPAPSATPFPDCWSNAFTSGTSPAPAASIPAGTTTITEVASGYAFQTKDLSAPADKAFAIAFDNQDSDKHNVEIKNPDGTDAFKGEVVTGPVKTTYLVPALKAGIYPFQCTVHPNMTGTLTVK
jgi:mono/diheme cytochrome c family protein/plastocyanin